MTEGPDGPDGLKDPDAWVRFHICKSPLWRDVTRLGVAVSGGSDSMALLHLLAECAEEQGVTLAAATVDHGLRPGSAEEAKFVKKTCEALDCHHETLRWKDWDGRGNLQAEARRARYRLLGAWAARRNLDAVALGHTMDDQAETFLMRLAREAGVDGLSAMDRTFTRDGANFWRPALLVRRAELRGYLTRRGLDWREDRSNDDAAFDRVRARKTLSALAPVGIDAGTLAAVAVNLGAAREALAMCTFETAERIAREEAGDVLFDAAGFEILPWEIQRRLLSAALTWAACAEYAPRRDAMIDLDVAILRGQGHTLHGCLVTTSDKSVRIGREYNAVKDTRAPLGALWDNRWRVIGPDREGLEVRALGDGVNDCPDWRNTGLPRRSLMASPAVWQGDTLIAAPIAGLSGGFSAQLDHPQGDFVACLIAH